MEKVNIFTENFLRLYIKVKIWQTLKKYFVSWMRDFNSDGYNACKARPLVRDWDRIFHNGVSVDNKKTNTGSST